MPGGSLALLQTLADEDALPVQIALFDTTAFLGTVRLVMGRQALAKTGWNFRGDNRPAKRQVESILD